MEHTEKTKAASKQKPKRYQHITPENVDEPVEFGPSQGNETW